MSLLDEALQAPGCVLSVIGSHAGEQAAAIFGRKIADCGAVGRTFWVARSSIARPLQVQELCAAGGAYVVFIEPSSVGGSRPTIEAERAREYSPDRANWLPLPPRLGPVTGKMDRGTTAFVLGDLSVDVRGVLDLWEYVNWSDPTLPVKFTPGGLHRVRPSRRCCAHRWSNEVSMEASCRSGASLGTVLRVG